MLSVSSCKTQHKSWVSNYTLGRPLRRDVLWSFFGIFFRPSSWYCSFCAAQLATRATKRKENITTERTPQSVGVGSILHLKIVNKLRFQFQILLGHPVDSRVSKTERRPLRAKRRHGQTRAVTIPALDPALESNFNSFFGLWRFRFRIRIQVLMCWIHL